MSVGVPISLRSNFDFHFAAAVSRVAIELWTDIFAADFDGDEMNLLPDMLEYAEPEEPLTYFYMMALTRLCCKCAQPSCACLCGVGFLVSQAR
jgi:hypothetical protein